MKTLYALLGVARDASSEQIELGYRKSLDTYLADPELQHQDDVRLRMQAVREAYLLLSSPARRRAYDQRLDANSQAHEVHEGRAERGRTPWTALLLLAGLLIVGGNYYHKVQRDRAQIELETVRLKAAARSAESAASESARPQKPE